MKNTMAQIEKLSSEKLTTMASAYLPAGHFLVFAKIKGKDNVYLMQGKDGDKRSVIKGHTETRKGAMRSFHGNAIEGGTEFSAYDYSGSFRTMANSK